MRRLRTGLSRRGGKCAGKRLGISRIRFGLVFRGLDEKCTHNRNEISALAGELVFRQVPGKSVQGWGRAERFGVGVLVALLEAIGDGVGGISGAPTGLGFLAPGLLAVRLAAGVLAVADSVIRLEPPAADPAGPLAGIGHAGPSSAGWVGQFGRVGVGQFSRAPKPPRALRWRRSSLRRKKCPYTFSVRFPCRGSSIGSTGRALWKP